MLRLFHTFRSILKSVFILLVQQLQQNNSSAVNGTSHRAGTKEMTMRDEQEQSIKEKTPPPQEDSRIDILIRAYRNLAVKVDLLQ